MGDKKSVRAVVRTDAHPRTGTDSRTDADPRSAADARSDTPAGSALSGETGEQASPPPGPAEAWGALLRVHATVVPLLDRDLQATNGLPLAWYDVLLELNSAADRRLRMSDLGERVVLSRTRVSRLVDELSAAGLVRREANPDDRRSSYAAMTIKGRTAFRQAAPSYLRGIDRAFGDLLTPAELTAITVGLQRVLRHAADRNPA